MRDYDLPEDHIKALEAELARVRAASVPRASVVAYLRSYADYGPPDACPALDAVPFDLNKIAMLPGVSREDHAQFAQLIGYSVSGYGDLSYALNVAEADAAAARRIAINDAIRA